MTIKRLASGYWYVRWSTNQWAQWPTDTLLTTHHAFGWVTGEMLAEAQRAVDAMAAVPEEAS